MEGGKGVDRVLREERVEWGPESTKILHRDSLSGNGEVDNSVKEGVYFSIREEVIKTAFKSRQCVLRQNKPPSCKI